MWDRAKGKAALTQQEGGRGPPTSHRFSLTHVLSIGLDPERRGRKVQKEGKISYADFVWFLISEEDKKTPTRYVFGGCPGSRRLAVIPERGHHQGSIQARSVPGRVHAGQGWPGWGPQRAQLVPPGGVCPGWPGSRRLALTCCDCSIEYWFRCMDLDGDGALSMFELEYFYEEQCRRLDSMAIEALPFEDCLCQMLDLVKPQSEGNAP